MRDSVARSAPEAICPVIAPDLVICYGRGVLGSTAAWSVEEHLPACGSCRSVLAEHLDQARLNRNRSVLITRLAMQDGPAAGWLARLAERAVARCGVPGHVWRLLSVTPSLRRSWLAGVALVLGTAIGAARFSASVPGLGGTVGHGGTLVEGLLPFLILAPLLPLAGVAAAFHPRLDPAADLATAAPVSGVWLFCVRSAAVIGAALIPTVLAALALPGSGWLPTLVVLPALAVSAVALALATLVQPLPAALGAGAGWVAAVCGAGLVAGSPAVAYRGAAQAAWFVVVAAACCLLAVRHRTLDFGWNR
jgi:hypothetical protein